MSGQYSERSSGTGSSKSFDIMRTSAVPPRGNTYSVDSSQLTFLRTQASSVIGSSSTVVKFICLAVIIGYLISFSSQALNILTVLPGNLIPPNFWLWTCITHSFIERHWWMVLCDIVVIVLYAKLLEPLWGTLETVRFYFVITITIALLTALTYLLVYFVTGNTDYLFKQHIHGLAGYLAAFAVAVKQSMSDHVLVSTPFGKLRNRHVPLWVLLAAVIVRLAGGVDPPFPVMFAWGLVVSWIYLRFYQRHSNGNCGDMADSFSFASFFPDMLQPIISLMSNTVFSFLVTIHICKKQTLRRLDAASPVTVAVSIPGTDPQDSERRRQLALKALNERLSRASAASWPEQSDSSSSSSRTSAVDSSAAAVNAATAASVSAAADSVTVDISDKESKDEQLLIS